MTNSMSREQLKKIIFDFRCEIDYDAKGIYIGEGNHEWGDEEDNKLAEAIWNAIPEVNIPSIEEMSSKYPQKGKRKNEPSFNPMASPARDKSCEHQSREIITIAVQTWEWCRNCGSLKYDCVWHNPSNESRSA